MCWISVLEKCDVNYIYVRHIHVCNKESDDVRSPMIMSNYYPPIIISLDSESLLEYWSLTVYYELS